MKKLYKNKDFFSGLCKLRGVPAVWRRYFCGIWFIFSMAIIWGIWKFRQKGEVNKELYHK